LKKNFNFNFIVEIDTKWGEYSIFNFYQNKDPKKSILKTIWTS